MVSIKTKGTKDYVTVDFAEIEPLFNLLSNTGMHPNQAMTEIGYSASMLIGARKEGRIRKVALYALKGLIAERSDRLPKPDKTGLHLTREDLETLFLMMTQARKALPGHNELIGRVIGALSVELVRMGENK